MFEVILLVAASLCVYWYIGYVRALQELKIEAGRECAEFKEWLEAKAKEFKQQNPWKSHADEQWKFVSDDFEYKGEPLPSRCETQPWLKSEMYALFKADALSISRQRAALWFWPSGWTLRGRYFEQGEAQYAELKRLQEIIVSENLDPYNIIDWETFSCGKR